MLTTLTSAAWHKTSTINFLSILTSTRMQLVSIWRIHVLLPTGQWCISIWDLTSPTWGTGIPIISASSILWKSCNHTMAEYGNGTIWKLSSSEVITLDAHEAHSIINRYTAQHDGYKVLYALLEDVNPCLSNCMPLELFLLQYLYTTCYDLYLTFWTLTDCKQTICEQIILFINWWGAQYQPAIHHIHTMMDNWEDDTQAPNALMMHAFPRSIKS